jgi:hypothetical protein
MRARLLRKGQVKHVFKILAEYYVTPTMGKTIRKKRDQR